MGLVKGLSALNSALDKPTPTEGGAKGRWLKLDDGQSTKIRFLQELDPDSVNYSDKAGLGFIAVEHTNPTDYRRKALCSSEDQGRCFGCEMHRRDPKAGWKGKSRLYINVLVDDGTEDPYVAIFSQGAGGKSVTPAIIDYAGATGSITNVVWKLKRSGTKTDTSYSIIPLPSTGTEPIDFDKYELFDLEKTAVRDVLYSEQEDFYLGRSSNDNVATTSSVEW